MNKDYKDKILLIPYGGLANRMRSIDSAITLCKQNNRELEIVWFRHEALNADFSTLFEPIDMEGVTLRDASKLEYYIYDRPRRRNFHLPALFERLLFDFRVYEEESARKYHAQEPFTEFASPGKGYIVSCYQMTPTELNFSMLRPVETIHEEIRKRLTGIDVKNCAGVHIRRGDNIYSISNSPDELFMSRMEADLENGLCNSFYLATDSDEVKQKMKDAFGDKVHFLDKESSRLNVSGMQDAVLEMYLLSSMKYIIGSYGSTYSQTAAWIGNKPYTEIRKESVT